MSRWCTYIRAVIGFAIMLLLITCTNIAATGVASGIDLCIRVVIPSLFPFFIITSWLNGSIQEITIPGLRLLGRFLHLSAGSEGIFFIGLLGGYPIGAQCIADANRHGQIDTIQANRMLGFCSNAGPAFIFGITRLLFSSKFIPWIVWMIQISSAIFVGMILPPIAQQTSVVIERRPISFIKAMKQSTQATASVCGWIILFKTIQQFLTPITRNNPVTILILGFLELSNGILQLDNIPVASIRFIFCSAYLGFGGLCVWMQTYSTTGSLGTGLYLPGKLIQLITCILLSSYSSIFLFQENIITPVYLLVITTIGLSLICQLRKYCAKKLWKLTQI